MDPALLRRCWFAWSLLAAILIARRGYKKRSLNLPGAMAAIAVGFIHMVCGLQYGLLLIVFYLSSSKLTKVKADVKSRLHETHEASGRGAVQVLSNSLGGCIFAILSVLLQPVDPLLSCCCQAAFLAHYACCCGDTWASEVGILSKREPRLLTTLKRVPPGTNGGVSSLGTACSAAAGLLMGFTFWLTSWLLHVAYNSLNAPQLYVPKEHSSSNILYNTESSTFSSTLNSAGGTMSNNFSNLVAQRELDWLQVLVKFISFQGNRLPQILQRVWANYQAASGNGQTSSGLSRVLPAFGQGLTDLGLSQTLTGLGLGQTLTGLGQKLTAVGGTVTGLGQTGPLVTPLFLNPWWLVLGAAAVAVAGSVIDSFLGATLQYSGFDEEHKLVVDRPGARVKHISGLNLLSNSMVNFVSAAVCSAGAAAVVFMVL